MLSQGLLFNQVQQLYDKDDTGEWETTVYSLSHMPTLLEKWRKEMPADYQPSARLFISLSFSVSRYLYHSSREVSRETQV